MRTALRRRLNDQQFGLLVQRGCARARELKTEMEGSTWYQRRMRAEREAASIFEDRKQDPTTPEILKMENKSLHTIRAINRFLEARLFKDLFGSTPWFQVRPEGPMEKALADQIQPHASWKMRQAGVLDKYRQAIRKALDLGECGIKTTWRCEEDNFEKLALVLVDKRTGEPVQTFDGEPIFATDETQEIPMPQASGLASMPPGTGNGLMPQMSSSPMDADGGMDSGSGEDQGMDGMDAMDDAPQTATVFLKDPSIVMDPAVHEWREEAVTYTARRYCGLDVEAVYWRDLYYPMNVADLDRADMVVHERDLRPSEIRQMWGSHSDPEGKEEDGDDQDEDGQEGIGDYAEDSLRASITPPTSAPDGTINGHNDAQTPQTPQNPPPADNNGRQPLPPNARDAEFEQALAQISSEGIDPKTYQAQPKYWETTSYGAQEDPPVKISELYWDCADAEIFPDGRLRRLYLVVDITKDVVIYAEYRAVVSPRSVKPIHLIAVNREPGRVYGTGNYELYEMAQIEADRCLSQITYGDEMVANPPIIWNPHRTEEGKADPNLKIKPGVTLTISSPQHGPDDVLSFCKVPDRSDRTYQMMQLWMQLVQAESGVTNAAQAAVSNLPGNDLATGVNALTEVASILHLHLLEEVKQGFSPQVGYSVEVIYFWQDQDETYQYLEGQADAVLALADAEQLRELPMHVEILLTRAKQQQQRQAAAAAIPLGTQFYGLAPQVQLKLRNLFVEAFSGLGYQNADQYFTSQDELLPGLAQVLAQAGYQVVPPGQGMGSGLGAGGAATPATNFHPQPSSGAPPNTGALMQSAQPQPDRYAPAGQADMTGGATS